MMVIKAIRKHGKNSDMMLNGKRNKNIIIGLKMRSVMTFSLSPNKQIFYSDIILPL